MNSVCIVTNEVYPIDKGGIARLMYNFAINNSQSETPADIHFLLPAKWRMHTAEVEAEFVGLAKLHYCRESLEGLGTLGTLIRTFGAKDSLDHHMIESLRYYAGLLDAQQELGREFDIVEFPDFGGWGFASIAARRAGLNFKKTRFTIRLHSTESLIVDHEPFVHQPSDWIAGICDLERQALLDADKVIAHLPSIAKLNADRFAFPPEWNDKIHIEMPPIVLAEPELEALAEFQAREEPSPPPRNFLFSARLQPFKRPELFIRAAVWFLDNYADANNLFLISSYGWDKNYIDWLHRLVPVRWRDSVVFLEGLTQQQRVELMLNSILVIPSEFESLCLLAYEGRLLNLKVVLNGRCLAFGAEPERWQDGENCLLFDSDFISLAQTMRKALDWTPKPAEPLPRATPYWEKPMGELFTSAAQQETPPLTLSYLVYGSTNLDELGQRLQDLSFGLGLDNVHALVPRQAFDAAAIPPDAWQISGVTIHLTSWLEPTASEIQNVIADLKTGAVAFLPADTRAERELWTLAAAQLAAEPDAAIFTSHVAVKAENAPRRFLLNYGDARTVALITDRIAHRASVFRRDALLKTGLREAAGGRWHEDLCIRLVNAGHRVLTAPAVLAMQSEWQRSSRIPSARFFGSLRDEAGHHAHLPYRQGSVAAGLIDSVAVIDHDTWVAQQAMAITKLAASARVPSDVVHFEDVKLTNVPGTDPQSPIQLQIVLHGLTIGRTSVQKLSFKLSRYKTMAWVEFRDGGHVEKLFSNWPPQTSDQWGPIAIWSNNIAPHANEGFFYLDDKQNRKKLDLLLDNLPAMIGLLPLTPAERTKWNEIAAALLMQSRTRLKVSGTAGRSRFG
jgi:glycosyltransferase involved in cell wall biosynthesis